MATFSGREFDVPFVARSGPELVGLLLYGSLGDDSSQEPSALRSSAHMHSALSAIASVWADIWSLVVRSHAISEVYMHHIQ